MTIETLQSIPDDELLAQLSKLLERSRWVEAELVAHIGEVDARRLYARRASPSMFSYCVDLLHLSEHEAYLRIAVGPDRALPASPGTEPAASSPAQTPPPRSPDVEPLAPARYKVQFTAGAELRDKLQYLQALMGEDLAGAIEAAVTEKIERLEARRYGRTSKPAKTVAETDTAPSSRHIPAALRRAVHARDGGRCTFRDANGRRCSETQRLEFHHDTPYGRGGGHSVENLRLACKAHNGYYAEKEYGKDAMDRYRRSGSMAREPAPAFSVRTERPRLFRDLRGVSRAIGRGDVPRARRSGPTRLPLAPPGFGGAHSARAPRRSSRPRSRGTP